MNFSPVACSCVGAKQLFPRRHGIHVQVQGALIFINFWCSDLPFKTDLTQKSKITKKNLVKAFIVFFYSLLDKLHAEFTSFFHYYYLLLLL